MPFILKDQSHLETKLDGLPDAGEDARTTAGQEAGATFLTLQIQAVTVLDFDGGGAGNQDDLDEAPSQLPCYRITLANNQQRSGLCERCQLKRRDAKNRDGSDALGVVIHLPIAKQRSMRIQTRAVKCRQAILRSHERHRSKSGEEDPRR